MFDRAQRLAEATPAACRAAVDALAPGAGLVVLLVAEQPELDVEAIAAALGPTPVLGAVFPALIEGAELFRRGALVLTVDAPARRAILPSTFEPSDVLRSILAPALEPPTPHDPSRPPTLLTLFDGAVAGASTSVLDALRLPYLHLGARFFGGGAGYAQPTARPCLFTERGALPPGGGLVAIIEATSSVASEHGWSQLSGPYFASRTARTTVCELDWRPAREVYAEALGRAGEPRVSLMHPLGLILGDRLVVRDPLAFTEDGGIYTFGDVGARALVAILRAEPDALIGAAGAAARAALLGAAQPAASSFVVDCVSRADTLGARFGEELVRIRREATPRLWGALSLGEVASSGERGVEFHNKTVVVTVR